MRNIPLAILALALSVAVASAQQVTAFRDSSPHKVQFVTVDQDVKLEVLDWGGTGRAVVLLAGLGNTAHVFDDFAPKLTRQYHIFGITRRGFGASSSPGSGYSADRLGDDVLAVLDALKLDRPVLVGHSIAGEELSSIGSRHPEKVAGLVYLDAGYSYAYYDRNKGDIATDLPELQKQLDELKSAEDLTEQKPLIEELLQTGLPRFEEDLRLLDTEMSLRLPPVPKSTSADRESFEAYRSWEKRIYGVLMPEAELRWLFQELPGGQVGEPRTNKADEVSAGLQKYTEIKSPTLAFFADPEDLGPFVDNTPAALTDFDDDETALTEPQVEAFEAGVPSAKVIRLANANHYVFMSNEADVLREMRAFIERLP